MDEELEKVLVEEKNLLFEEEEKIPDESEYSDTIKSQKFFNQFMNFMCNILNIKNRSL